MQGSSERGVLLVVDVQNDFCPGGALAVPEGDAIVPAVNRLARDFAHVVLTQDWHPAGHSSFAATHGRRPYETVSMPYGEQILWPDHCVQGTRGSDFHPALDIPHAELVLRKGHHRTIDSYSAFRENDRETATGLTAYLKERGFARVALCGLATDFCVLYSALDAVAAGFGTRVVLEACRGIDVDNSVARALDEMRQAGVVLL